MIVKIKTRKTPSYKQLLNYMLHHKGRLFDKGNKSFLLKHNIKGDTVEEWTNQYKENETHRKYRRIKSVLLSHEILSWHIEDTPNITLAKMEAMAREYIKLRNPRGMYVVVPHTDKQHYHIHICAAGLEYHTGKTMRMSKQQFTELKQKIQGFQREKFPELSKSIVEHGKTEKKDLALSTEKEYQLKLWTGRATDREKVISVLKTCYDRAMSKEDFFELAKDAGLKTYSRGGKITGIIYANRKFRFKRVGFTEERLTELEMIIIRSNELNQTREKYMRTIDKER